MTRPRGRGYTWAPFEAGNTAALVHGGNSARTRQLVAESIDRLREELSRDPGDLTPSATVVHQLGQADALAEVFAAAVLDAFLSGERDGVAWRSREFRHYVRLGLELRREAGLASRVRLERLRAMARSMPAESGLDEFVARALREADDAGTA
ncbi:MAG TPA: hypothetical protein VG650_14075 [Mycobacteriales bacterium]|nr:hypothetical protein [Mycobacteriales bacterium]